VDIPITIISKRNSTLPAPLWATVYGAYGFTLSPYFKPTRLAFLERGGVVAFIHARGGGEKGRAWHDGGRGSNKENTIRDTIDATEYLISQGYTTPKLMGLNGASAGGIPAAGAMVARPDLYAAVVLNAAVTNPLRLEKNAALGPLHAKEFGSSDDPSGAAVLAAIDSYSHIKPGVKYPATFLLAGAADFRVPSWQATKMHAKLSQLSGGGGPFLLRVDDVGHQGAVTSDQAAVNDADAIVFFLWQLGHPEFQ
jgi:prolyl oligopeptidase